MTALAALGLGLVIGAFLGALGGGGAILTVPALVYLLGQSARDATTSSLIIVGAAALTGMIGYARSGHVRWRLGVMFGIAGTAAAYLGTALNRQVNQHYLLIAFAVVMGLAATGMLLRARNRKPEPATASVGAARFAGPAESSDAERTVAARAASPVGEAPARSREFGQGSRWTAGAKILVAGLGVGFMTGFFGVGGGFVIVPVLVLLFDLSMPVAAATSLLIIAINSAASLVARAGTAHFHWAIIVPFTIAAMAASLAGKTIAGRLPDRLLTRIFAAMLIAIGLFVAVQNIAQIS
ncbi:hypothetical protein SAMN04515671_0758 [Nakamurella panacisegetis]|uniref:Probable membrane transporter protein n=1 Tax=Nakamurella panacisegetis TaxID=1090615 RepID=A0A1H0J2R2_9ACTN|nr:sulfite exporter TauE/SafE family protein [Nakamurella panacisegetis]SDO38088.1 hypothetical protein SAMN04515671_0758 [Nakamurella panacisegetis]